MQVKEYVRKPDTIVRQAILWDGTPDTMIAIEHWLNGVTPKDRRLSTYVAAGPILTVWNAVESRYINVPLGHYVIKGIQGEFYPCAPDIFDESYMEKEDG